MGSHQRLIGSRLSGSAPYLDVAFEHTQGGVSLVDRVADVVVPLEVSG